MNIADYQKAQGVALSTWHGDEDITNPLMQFVIETSELAKHFHKATFKPGHELDREAVKEEAGDALYYFLILPGLGKQKMKTIFNALPVDTTPAIESLSKGGALECLKGMAVSAAILWNDFNSPMATYQITTLATWVMYFEVLLLLVEMPVEEVVRRNQEKLAGGDNHGWAGADSREASPLTKWGGKFTQPLTY